MGRRSHASLCRHRYAGKGYRMTRLDHVAVCMTCGAVYRKGQSCPNGH